ncbi:cupin domain-containing protein [Carnobacteriaceae bacterium 52-44]
MVEPIYLSENEPYPNNTLPVLYFENVLASALGDDYTGDDVLQLFTNNGYTGGWKGGIKDRHHFHSTAHEALACTEGELRVQFGGQNGEILTIRKGDVMLLPAGTAHKKLDATEKHEIIGAYPLNDSDYDFQYGDASDYEAIKESIQNVNIPDTDPVTGAPSNIQQYWEN